MLKYDDGELFCFLLILGPTDALRHLQASSAMYHYAALHARGDADVLTTGFYIDDEPLEHLLCIEDDSAAYPMLTFGVELYRWLEDDYILNGEIVERVTTSAYTTDDECLKLKSRLIRSERISACCDDAFFCRFNVVGPSEALKHLKRAESRYHGADSDTNDDVGVLRGVFFTGDGLHRRMLQIEDDSAAYPMLMFQVEFYRCFADGTILNGEVVEPDWKTGRMTESEYPKPADLDDMDLSDEG